MRHSRSGPTDHGLADHMVQTLLALSPNDRAVDGASSVAHVIGHLADRKVQSWSGRTALRPDAWLQMSARFSIQSKLFKDEVEGVRPRKLTPVVQPPDFRVLYLWKETHFISYCLFKEFMDDSHRRAEVHAC